MKILLAVDGSSYSRRMLAYLAAHDEWLGAQHEYSVLTVVPGVPARASAVLDKKILKDYVDDEAERVLKPIRAFFERQGIRANYLSKVGHAAEVIASQAQRGGFDLLLMGSHGHGNLASLVMGSVTARVLASCKTPVLLVR
jgi:nucleotide-binding universal stress UspA family protein